MTRKRFGIIFVVFVVTGATILNTTTINGIIGNSNSNSNSSGSGTVYSTRTGYGFSDNSEMSGSISSFSGYGNNNMSDEEETYNTTVPLPEQPAGETSAAETIENMTILPTPSEEEISGDIASLGGDWKDLDELK